jgi:hypothetical protein
MTMHLLPPMYSTTGKKKSKFKFASSEQKQQSEQLAREWEELKKKHTTVTKSNRLVKKPSFSVSIPKNRSTEHIPSKNSGIGTAAKADIPVYTGTKMLGIGVLHKSNAVPVFSDEEAIDISKMRRG